jgi:hypothetical protein
MTFRRSWIALVETFRWVISEPSLSTPSGGFFIGRSGHAAQDLPQAQAPINRHRRGGDPTAHQRPFLDSCSGHPIAGP